VIHRRASDEVASGFDFGKLTVLVGNYLFVKSPRQRQFLYFSFDFV